MASIRRKSAAVALAVVGIAGLSLASAAQLNVSSASIGASSNVVASCQDSTKPAIKVSYTNGYTGSAKAYTTSAVVLSGIDRACENQAVRVTVADGAGASLGELTGTVPAGGGSMTLSGINVPATSVENVAVVIAG